MLNYVLKKIVGTKNERELRRIQPLAARVAELEPKMKALPDSESPRLTARWKEEVQQKGRPLDELMPEVFAAVREASVRALSMRHFDVQLIGGAVLHQGKISEMKTGEGKTLVATLPAYLNSLTGKGVHVVTVNDYLARRDAEWMGPIYKMLGLSVGVIVHDLDDAERRAAYAADVTYGTNNEFGFDYLRDNMKFDIRDCVQRGHNYAIVDEVDSILIDEARTPLIISGASAESTDKYYKVNRIIPKLEKGEEIDTQPGEPKIMTGDYVVDEKHRNVTVTDEGWEKVEKLLGIGNIADPENWALKHHVDTAIKAHALYKRDVEYVVKDGEVIIVDEFTGRLMPGRRWSDGLHQAVEAKENVKIERENQTLATITFQNYFRMYKKLAGMTGTAETEAPEFDKIYKLEVVAIPTNKTLIRVEHSDVVYRTEAEKFEAAVNGILQEDNTKEGGIRQYYERGQPVLVGSISIEKSEKIAEHLKKAGIPHQVLNAKQHEREAKIIAQAGRKGAVTVSTNMAGRGTDILLGGNPEAMTREYALKNKLAMPYMPAGAVIGAAAGAESPPQADAAIAGASSASGTGAGTSGNGASGANSAPMVLFQQEGKIYQVPLDQWKPLYDQFAEQCRAEHDEGVAMGGCHILGTERHEARRIDNQLRGRAGRQGDPGSSRFFLSLEDDLLRIFGGERVKALMYRLGMTEGVPIESRLISKRIENAQNAGEAQNFEARKHLLEYDDVMNKQRETIYSLRRAILEGADQKELVLEKAEEIAYELVDIYCPRDQHPDQWNVTQFSNEALNQFGLEPKAAGIDVATLNHDALADALIAKVNGRYEEKEKMFGAQVMRWLERRILLDIVDAQWKDHLLSLDHLKEGIGLRGYAQKDPLVEFKKEAFTLFDDLMDRIDKESVRFLFLVQPAKPEDEARQIERRQRQQQKNLEFQTGAAQDEPPKPVRAAAYGSR